ncbi:hypothetical protein GDO86_014189 [Hymenochirus boettgeri]|uniref:GH3 domain-containing protein n=1 Tax=Hymenochirus boettgeri TaxID=247094 RepID=A0A8T2JT28_9PIPI|nr:hypothetical protein GDO86_014189 [Hymenochirus boettgeri]
MAVFLFIFSLFLGAFGCFLLALLRNGRKWLAHFWHWKCLYVISKEKHRKRLERETKDAYRIQEEILNETLLELKDTVYGKKHHFKNITDASSFQQSHPLTDYHNYKDYIQQISNGEENILVQGRPLALVATAGTSGSPSTVPVTEKYATERLMQGTMLCLEVIHSNFPGSLEKVARFSFPPKICYSKAGIPIGPYPLSTEFKLLEPLYTSRLPSHPTMSTHDLLYVQILFALKDPDLTALEVSFSWILRQVFYILEKEWETIVMDIMQGGISSELKIPQDIRQQLEKMLIPDPRRARELHAQFGNGFLGIASRLWPKMKVVIAVYSGLDGQFLNDVPCQGIILYSPLYCTAEGLIGVNITPSSATPQYVLCPHSAFFEFIPVETGIKEPAEIIRLQDVCVEKAYELVITNRDGLFRYRLGDVVRIVSFHNQSPILEFLYRKSQTLSVRGENITEDEFYRILLRTVDLWPGATLVNYCCAESQILGQISGGSDPHYEVFVALKGVRDLSEEQRYKLDQVLQEHVPLYKSFRFKGSIGPVRVYLASPKAFISLLELSSTLSGAPLESVQSPRTLRYRELAESIRKQILS